MTNTPTNNQDVELDKLFYRALRGKTVTPEQSHILDWAEARLKPALATLIHEKQVEARIEGRKIQAEATLDKWKNTPYAGDSSVFPEFLHGQVEAHKYELDHLSTPKEQGDGGE